MGSTLKLPCCLQWPSKSVTRVVLKCEFTASKYIDRQTTFGFRLRFVPYAVSQIGLTSARAFYVATDNTSVAFKIDNGKVVSSTSPVTIEVKSSGTTKTNRTRATKLTPRAKIKQGNLEAELELIQLSNEKAAEFAQTVTFEAIRQIISRSSSNAEVQWSVAPAQLLESKDELFEGDVELFVACESVSMPAGRIEIRTESIMFYDTSKKRTVGRLNSAIMACKLYKHKRLTLKHFARSLNYRFNTQISHHE